MKRRAGKSNNYVLIFFMFLIFTLMVVFMNGKTIHEAFMDSIASPSTAPNAPSSSDIKVYIEYYYSESCGFCIDFNKTGIWKELESMPWKKVKLAKYQLPHDRANKFNISSVPTIIAVDKNSDAIVKTFTEDRTLDNLKKFISLYEDTKTTS